MIRVIVTNSRAKTHSNKLRIVMDRSEIGKLNNG
jgi:hypothetical protein